ncbi:hypothetical protein [Pseudomonas tolaasii]|uniref:hypothetical protein n=1 Tax=Pseudomonas tolaasii TaxID=29442 RepID=UPI0027354F71|nr:hypothetical protein [Pseudomonas tolaasii]WLH49715.1 hypothetical protein PSH62_16605 [Pseudomonas tolaasii]
MNLDEDTSAWLGCPTPLEMYQHHCSLLEDELTTAYQLLKKARANIAGLVQMSDALATDKAAAEKALKKALDNIARLNLESSQQYGKIRSLELVRSQCDYLFRENQRLLLELRVFRGPRP